MSDRASRGEYEDKSGQAIYQWLQDTVISPWKHIKSIIPDEQKIIEETLCEWSDKKKCNLILTTGGTGPAPRDKTPEATLAIADRVLDGFGERMRSISLQYAPTAILSRQVGVIRNTCLIVNLPGQPKAIKEILDTLFEAIPYCVELVSGSIIRTDEKKVKVFRPKSANRLDN